jgi:hypothetical protein
VGGLPVEDSPPDEEDKEEDDNDDFDIVKEEADWAMADAVPPGAEDLPPEY